MAYPSPVILNRAPDGPRAEIRIKVNAIELRVQLAPITVAAGHRAPKRMAILKHGKGRATVQELIATSRRLILEAVHSLQHVPAVVLSSGACCWLIVDFFPLALSDVGDKEISSGPVEGASPGIAHAVCPNLVQRVRIAHERIVRWHCIVAIRVAGKVVAVNVHTQDLAQPGLEILSVLLRVPAAAAVAQRDVQEVIRAECQLPAIMIRERLVLSQDKVSRVWICDVGIFGRNRVAGNHGVTVYVRVINVEESVIGVVRVKSEAEQTLLATTAHQFMDIQERDGKECAIKQYSDLTCLLHDE